MHWNWQLFFPSFSNICTKGRILIKVEKIWRNGLTYKNICDQTGLTERSENEVKRASDRNDEGKLHNKERDGFKERVFAWPDAICGGYIKNDTCIGKITMVFIYICDHFFPLKLGFLSKFTPCTPPLGPPDMARNWGRKEKENKTGVRLRSAYS